MKRTGGDVPVGDSAAVAPPVHAGGAQNLVELDPDHPGFRDAAYRARRDAIARLALEYRDGDPVPDVAYTDDENGVWRAVWASLDPLHDRYACRVYRSCLADVALRKDRVPQLAEVNARLADKTGFRMLPVAGLVAGRTFLAYLGKGIFLSTQYMRHASRPLYTPEPDVVHELVGHAATFADPDFARLNRAFGAAMVDADDARAEQLARLYWYTLEFGLIEEDGALKVYGAGLLSSAGELQFFEQGAAIQPFDPEVASRTTYDPTDFQRTLFVAPSFDRVVEDVVGWLAA